MNCTTATATATTTKSTNIETVKYECFGKINRSVNLYHKYQIVMG